MNTPPAPSPLSASGRVAAATGRLSRHLALAYAVLIIYASLHPLSGWRDSALSPFAFLEAGWPRYWTGFDLAINVFAYLPLGFLLTLALRQLPTLLAAPTALLLGTLLSFSMESLQGWLPSRVPSNLDFFMNTLGCAIGAVLALWLGHRVFRYIATLRHWLAPGTHVEAGLVLVGLWLLTQLSPETFLFGTGDLRHLLEITPAVPYEPPSFLAIETAIVICNTVAIGLVFFALLVERKSSLVLLCTFLVLALAIRALAAAILVGPQQALIWLTPGAMLGLMIGGTVLALLLLPPLPWRIAFAGLALMAGTVLVNLMPPNPYSEAAMATWRQGHFLNFNGLTRLTASLWPFLALPYLMLAGRKKP